jgi:hypothetical protein
MNNQEKQNFKNVDPGETEIEPTDLEDDLPLLSLLRKRKVSKKEEARTSTRIKSSKRNNAKRNTLTPVDYSWLPQNMTEVVFQCLYHKEIVPTCVLVCKKFRQIVCNGAGWAVYPSNYMDPNWEYLGDERHITYYPRRWTLGRALSVNKKFSYATCLKILEHNINNLNYLLYAPNE